MRHLPATHAVMKQARVPAHRARKTILDKILRLLGANTDIPPICTPIELKLAKPHSAYVHNTSERI